MDSIDCVQNLHSRYKQDKYLEQASAVDKPERHELGRRAIKHSTGTCGNDRPAKIHLDEIMVVPIVDVLQWLKHDHFRNVL